MRPLPSCLPALSRSSFGYVLASYHYLIFLSCIVYFFSFRISLRRRESSFEGRLVASLVVLIPILTAVVASARLVSVVIVVVGVGVQRLIDSCRLVVIVVVCSLLEQKVRRHILILVTREVCLGRLRLRKAQTLKPLDCLHLLVSHLKPTL